jgi:hypothetical protein
MIEGEYNFNDGEGGKFRLEAAASVTAGEFSLVLRA